MRKILPWEYVYISIPALIVVSSIDTYVYTYNIVETGLLYDSRENIP